MMDLEKVAIIGGTGKQGQGLVVRLAKAGYNVIIGSRSEEKAKQIASMLEDITGSTILGLENQAAAKEANIIIITVPYAAHEFTLKSIKNLIDDKVIVDVTVPMNPNDITAWVQPEKGSAGERAAEILGSEVKLTTAFHNLSAHSLQQLENDLECDILICGEDNYAKRIVIDICSKIGLRGIDAGPLRNSHIVESITPMLIGLNKKYKRRNIGIKLTGI